MPFDGNGNFSLNQDFPRDRDLGRPSSLIDADKFADEFANFKAALETALLRDGQNEATDDIPMGGFSFTGMRAAAESTEPVIASQLSSGAFDWLGTAAGTANALTGTLSFAPTLASGVRVKGVVGITNTGAATLTLNSGSAVAIKRNDGTDLLAGDLTAGYVFSLVHNGTNWRIETPLTVDGRGAPIFLLSSVAQVGSAITATGPSRFQSIAAGQLFSFTASANGGAAPTLAISGGAAHSIRTASAAPLVANDIQTGRTYLIYFDGTHHRILSGMEGVSVAGTELNDLTDVSATSPTPGHVLTWNAAGYWEPAALAGGLAAVDILAALVTVDGASSGLDADALDGQHGSYYADIPARLGYTPLNLASYTAADVLAKILTVDGSGSALDADALDGQHGSYYADIPARLGYTPLNLASYTAADVLAKILAVDGSGSALDADAVDGLHASAFAQLAGAAFTGTVTATQFKPQGYTKAGVPTTAGLGSIIMVTDLTAYPASNVLLSTLTGGSNVNALFMDRNGAGSWVSI